MRPMLASRVIEMLAAAIREHGDRPVRGVLDDECDDDTGYELHVAKFVTGPEFVILRAPQTDEYADAPDRLALIDRLHELGERPEATEVPRRALDTYTYHELEAILRDEYGELPDGSDVLPDHGDWAESRAMAAEAAGEDVHAEAEAALGDRSAAKTVNFGALYGDSSMRTFMERLRATGGFPAAEAADAPDGWTDPANDTARLDDALRRLCEPLLVEATQELRRCRHAHELPEQAGNWDGPATDEELAAHLHDLYGDRVRRVLSQTYTESAEDMDRAVERFVSIAFSLAAVAERVVDAAELARTSEVPWRLAITREELDSTARLDYHSEVYDLLLARWQEHPGPDDDEDPPVFGQVQARAHGDDGSVELLVPLVHEGFMTDECVNVIVRADTPLSGDAWACLRCDDHELVRVRRG